MAKTKVTVEKPKKVSKVSHKVYFHYCLYCNKDVPLGWKGAGWHCTDAGHRVYICPECSIEHKLPQPNLDTFRSKRQQQAEVLPPSTNDPVDEMSSVDR